MANREVTECAARIMEAALRYPGRVVLQALAMAEEVLADGLGISDEQRETARWTGQIAARESGALGARREP